MMRAFLPLLVAALILAILPLFASRGLILVISEGAVLLAIATAWNMLASFGGIVLVGLPLFIGIGGYSTFVIANTLGIPPHLVLPIAGLISAAAGLLVSPLLFRLNGAQLAIGSWVMAEVGRLAVLQSDWLGAGGGINLRAIRAVPRAIRFDLNYGVAVAVALISLGAVLFLMRSRWGTALRAFGDSEAAATAVGIDPTRLRQLTLALTAGLTGLAAGAYYIQVLQIAPGSAFGINWMAVVIFIVVLGGIGSLEGPIIGAIVYFALRESLAGLGEVYFVLMGALAIGITIFMPYGIWGALRSGLGLSLFPIMRKPPLAETSTPLTKGEPT